MFEPFQKTFKLVANRLSMARPIEAAQVCHHFRQITPQVFKGIEDPEKFISPAHYKNHELTINVKSPAFAQEVIMRKESIIRELNTLAGRQIIKSLRTKLTQS